MRFKVVDYKKSYKNSRSASSGTNYHGVMRVVNQDLFTVLTDYTLAHCGPGPEDIKRNCDYFPEKIRGLNRFGIRASSYW